MQRPQGDDSERIRLSGIGRSDVRFVALCSFPRFSGQSSATSRARRGLGAADDQRNQRKEEYLLERNDQRALNGREKRREEMRRISS